MEIVLIFTQQSDSSILAVKAKFENTDPEERVLALDS